MPLKFGYPGLAAGFTLALSSLSAAVVHLHEKRPALPGKLKRASQKGKKYKLRHFKTMRVKRMTIEEGKRAGISRFPNFHKTGSVRGMKKLYYGQHCLLVRCYEKR